jgi:hypothetical protein
LDHFNEVSLWNNRWKSCGEMQMAKDTMPEETEFSKPAGAEDRAEKALSDIDADRLSSVRQTNERAFNEGARFSMRMETISDSGSKFEITGLDDKVGERKKSEESKETKGDYNDPAEAIKQASEGGTLGVNDQRLLTALTSLSNAEQAAVKKELGNVDKSTAQKYLLDHWDDLTGEDSEIDMSELTDAFGKGGLSANDRANLMFVMSNFDNIRDEQGVGSFWGSDISKADVKQMAPRDE